LLGLLSLGQARTELRGLVVGLAELAPEHGQLSTVAVVGVFLGLGKLGLELLALPLEGRVACQLGVGPRLLELALVGAAGRIERLLLVGRGLGPGTCQGCLAARALLLERARLVRTFVLEQRAV